MIAKPVSVTAKAAAATVIVRSATRASQIERGEANPLPYLLDTKTRFVDVHPRHTQIQAVGLALYG